jgi:hypothetical protein
VGEDQNCHSAPPITWCRSVKSEALKRAMTQQGSDWDAHVRRILDSLKVTPERLLDFHQSVARDAVSTVDRIIPDLIRPSKTRWVFTQLWWINLDTFDQRLRTTLDPLCVSYCYIDEAKGKFVYLRAPGWAQLPNDGFVGWGFHVPMNVASVSKFVTAIATVRLLRSSNILLTTPIAGFLPQYWTTGTGVGAITFHDLLGHESGLGGSLNTGAVPNTNSGLGDFATARDQIRRGSTGTGTYDYKNTNFAILRVLFATLTGTLDPAFEALPFIGISDDVFWDFVSAMAYCNYVNAAVFVPASINPREFKAEDIAAKGYGTPAAAPGSRVENDVANAGASGWHLSVGELIKLLGEFRHGGSIMAPWRAERLLSNLYGLDSPEIATKAGPVYRKGGRWFSATGQTMDSAIYLMPNGMRGSYRASLSQTLQRSLAHRHLSAP